MLACLRWTTAPGYGHRVEVVPRSCVATLRRSERLCHLCHTARIDTRTIVLKCHTNIPESKNAKCAAFVLMDMRNDS